MMNYHFSVTIKDPGPRNGSLEFHEWGLGLKLPIMKYRPIGFLSEEHISHDSEAFDYIKELHEYLWRFIFVHRPGAGGVLDDYLDETISSLELNNHE